MRFALAFALISHLAQAQNLPDAQTLLDRSAAVWKNFHSAEFDEEVVMETSYPGAPAVKIASEISAAFLNPGKTRMESKAAGATFLDVSDGETTWVYISGRKEYTRSRQRRDPRSFWLPWASRCLTSLLC